MSERHDRLISPAEAEALIRTHAAPLPATSLPLTELVGAILRERIAAGFDQPPFDRVTMDGIAFASAAYERGRRSFSIAGTQAAGAAPLVLRNDEHCIEVMTGAMLPSGCDCVVPVEKISVADGVAQLAPDAAPESRSNIHARGTDTHRGDELLQPGIRLEPAEVAVLAANGRTHASVTRRPRIVVISTGDELVEPGQPLADWQIYRSNVYAVMAALQRRGFAQPTLDHLPDDPGLLRERLGAHLQSHDVMILSGGVSMGRFDYVPQVLAELGVRVVFHKVAQRPGKPLWFGVGPAGQTVYALPGNPVSTLVCLGRYVFAGLETSLNATPGAPEPIALAERFEVKPALTVFIPVQVGFSPGHRQAVLRPTRGSGDFTSLIGTDGFVELPPGPATVAAGTPVALYSW
ncbi:MAG TPA: molybdopterin molybdotransferase MoeA [Steroidobacteraceae bacterium]|nr:molybdopterin molybdotransferase MoeA [Steroidobacteraceae bacterium]